MPEEHLLRHRRERPDFSWREIRIVNLAARLLQNDELAADHVGGGLCIVELRVEPSLVEPPFGDAIDAAFGVTEMRLGTEIVTGHGRRLERWGGAVKEPSTTTSRAAVQAHAPNLPCCMKQAELRPTPVSARRRHRAFER